MFPNPFTYASYRKVIEEEYNPSSRTLLMNGTEVREYQARLVRPFGLSRLLSIVRQVPEWIQNLVARTENRGTVGYSPSHCCVAAGD